MTQGNSYGQNYQGRRPALSLRETRKLIKTVKKSNSSSTKLKTDLGNNASTKTIQRTLKKRLQLLTEKHKDTMRIFCPKNVQMYWNSVWFTDEKKFNLA